MNLNRRISQIPPQMEKYFVNGYHFCGTNSAFRFCNFDACNLLCLIILVCIKWGTGQLNFFLHFNAALIEHWTLVKL